MEQDDGSPSRVDANGAQMALGRVKEFPRDGESASGRVNTLSPPTGHMSEQIDSSSATVDLLELDPQTAALGQPSSPPKLDGDFVENYIAYNQPSLRNSITHQLPLPYQLAKDTLKAGTINPALAIYQEQLMLAEHQMAVRSARSKRDREKKEQAFLRKGKQEPEMHYTISEDRVGNVSRHRFSAIEANPSRPRPAVLDTGVGNQVKEDGEKEADEEEGDLSERYRAPGFPNRSLPTDLWQIPERTDRVFSTQRTQSSGSTAPPLPGKEWKDNGSTPRVNFGSTHLEPFEGSGESSDPAESYQRRFHRNSPVQVNYAAPTSQKLLTARNLPSNSTSVANPSLLKDRCNTGESQAMGSRFTASIETQIMEQMSSRIRELELENKKIRQAGQRNGSSVDFQIFHCLYDDATKSETPYLSEPYWEMHGENVAMRGRFPVPDTEGYVKGKNIAMVIFKRYRLNYHQNVVQKAIQDRRHLPEPRPDSQDVLLSIQMAQAVEAFFDQSPSFGTEFNDVKKSFKRTKRLSSPFLWWYHCRGSQHFPSLSPPQVKLLSVLTTWIDENYSSLYDHITDQIYRGKVTHTSMEFLIRPGHVLVSSDDGVPRGHLAKSRPYLSQESKKEGQQTTQCRSTWKVRSISYIFSGTFHSVDKELEITLVTDQEDEEVDITSLSVVPVQYTRPAQQERLILRGKTFWKCRKKRFVSYDGNATNGKEADGKTDENKGQRFMLDFDTYKELHPVNTKYTNPRITGANKVTDLPTNDSEPREPHVFLFPPQIPGFHLRTKKWVDLEVEQIRDVVWNEQAFKSLVADEDMKELILALVTNQLADGTGADLIENKGNGLIMLLHGSPGTGKTFTAESVAEIAKKPLYPVTCGDIGTDPEKVEKYLESVFHLGKIWDCVVLLDEAEVFLEQRTLQDLKRNALVSVFLRALEYYEGILILTTNRVGTFDEAFKSRIQLALRYEKLKDYQRKQIWRNFMDRLKSLGEEENIDFDDITLHLDELAQWPMNGRQIRNSISTGRQLAKYMGRKMTFSHLKRAITVAEKFDKYLADVREADVEEENMKRVDGRYSDEFFARNDGTR